MIYHQNDCCECASPGFPCIGSRCELVNRAHYICDGCDEEVYPGELYWYDGLQLCSNCVIKELEVVEDE